MHTEVTWGQPLKKASTATVRVTVDGKTYEAQVPVGAEFKDVPLIATVEPPPAPCKYVGDELTGKQRDARELDHQRRWAFCLHEQKPLGEAVCPCRGCGPNCSGYNLAEDDHAAVSEADPQS